MLIGADPLNGRGAKQRDQLFAKFTRIKGDVGKGHGAPVLAIHRAVQHKPQPQLLRVQCLLREQLMGVEEVTAGVAGQKGHELAGGQFVGVQNGNACGAIGTDAS